MLKHHPVQSNTLAYHADMLNDRPRNEWFQHRIEQVSANKVVLDVGGGAGLLTYYALQAGAEHVYVVESDPGILRILRGVLSKCFDKERYTIIDKNFWTIDVEQYIPKNSIDVFVSETLGGAGIDEGLLTTWWCAKQFVKEDCVFIPNKVSIDVCYWDTQGFLGDAPEKSVNLVESSLPKQFIDAVVSTDAEHIELFQWRDVAPYNRGRSQLNQIYSLNWDVHNLPDYRFDLEFPNHIFPIIDFIIELDKGLVGFIPKMEDRYLYTFTHSHWLQAPFSYIPVKGRYRITYKNLGTSNFETQWVIQRLL